VAVVIIAVCDNSVEAVCNIITVLRTICRRTIYRRSINGAATYSSRLLSEPAKRNVQPGGCEARVEGAGDFRQELMALCSLAFWLLALFAAWAVEGQENGRGELHAVVECFVPSNDASAKPLQLISHLVDFVDENHHRQDRRDIALMYLPFFAGQMWFLGVWHRLQKLCRTEA